MAGGSYWGTKVMARSTSFLGGTACAEGILRRGQENDEARTGEYGRGVRRTHDAKSPGPKGLRAGGRPLRCAARPMSRIALRDAPGGSPRLRATQTLPPKKDML